MKFEALEGIFPYEPDEIDNVIRVIDLKRSEHPNKSPLVLLTWKMREYGRWGISRTQLSIEAQLVLPDKLHPYHPMFRIFLDSAFPSAMLVYAGSAIEGLDEAMWDNGVFSVKNYAERCNNGVANTLYPNIKRPEDIPETEVVDTQAILDVLKMDRTFEDVLRREDLLPKALRRHFYQSVGTRDRLYQILNLYRPVARAVLELTPKRVG